MDKFNDDFQLQSRIKTLITAILPHKNENMTEKEIKHKISLVENIGGMTVNERIFICGLNEEFEKSLKNDKLKAEKILEFLQVDKLSIDLILKE